MGQKPGPMLDDYATLIASRHVWVSEAAGRVLGILVLLPDPLGRQVVKVVAKFGHIARYAGRPNAGTNKPVLQWGEQVRHGQASPARR